MAKICEICKKGTTFGRHIRHKEVGHWGLKAPKKGRKLYPNLRTVRLIAEDTPSLKVKVCMKCYKRLKAEG